MQPVDISENKVIASLAQLARDLQMSRAPADTLFAVRKSFGDAFGRVATLMLSTRGLARGEYRIVRFDLADAPLPDSLEPTPAEQLQIHRGGIIGRIVETPRPQLLQDIDWSGDLALGNKLAEYTSLVAVPLQGQHLPMSWVILMEKSPAQLTAEDVEETYLRSVLVSSLMDSQALGGELARANEHIEAEMRQVGELQRSLLPNPLPNIPTLELAADYQPSGRAGGDIYDFFILDDTEDRTERWCVLIADASGHGIAAAVVIAIIQAVLHAHPATVRGPADLLMHANRHLCRKSISGFVTAFLGIYEPVTKRLTYASAGHPPPLLKSANGSSISHLDKVSGLPLGIEPDEAFAESSVDLNAGETLLLYTDGITEARAPDNAMLESEGLVKVALETKGNTKELVQKIRQAVCAHENGRPRIDDQTLVAMRMLADE